MERMQALVERCHLHDCSMKLLISSGEAKTTDAHSVQAIGVRFWVWLIVAKTKHVRLTHLRERQSSTLKTVLGINAVMFAVELAAGLIAGSTALLSDSLDNLGDALTYGLSLYAVSRGARSKAKVALFKGGLILIAGLFVLGQVVYRLMVPTFPVFETMGAVG